MTRDWRKIVARVCLGALLFLQLAVAAYACPMNSAGATQSSGAATPMAQPCQGLEQEQPKLCEQHCVQASQSVDTQPHSLDAPVLQIIASVAPSKFYLPVALRSRCALLATVVDPPPLVRFGVLRI